jgi:mitochondrial import receptor subunit TOM22
MVIVHEIRDEDEDFESQLVENNNNNNDSNYEYTSDEDEDDELEEYNNSKNGINAFFASFIPVRIRSRLSVWSRRALSSSVSLIKFTGKAAWILTTSLLLIGLPLLYAYDREKSLVEYEKEQQRFAPPVASQ